MTLVLIVPSFYSTNLTSFSWNFLLTNLLIGIISFFMIIVETRKSPYSLHLIHWIFHYTFFFIAPLVQYLYGTFPWRLLYSSNVELLVITNLTILLWHFCWIIPTKFIKPKEPSKELYSLHISYKKIFTLFFLSFIVLVYLLSVYGFGGLFTRGSEADNLVSNSSLQLFLWFFARSIPVVLLVLLGRKTNRSKLLTMIALILVILTNFPSATPRFWAAALIMGLIFTFFKIKSRNILIYFILLGLNIVFPILATVRNASNVSEFFMLLNPNQILSKNLITADYDAFSMIAYTWKYIEIFGTTYGNQLLTVILFFVPRSLWADKSIGSGHLVADNLGFVFSNVSSPLPAEGLINFGVFGVILFALFFSSLLLKVDNLYWKSNQPFIKTIYPFWIGFFFFIMRGDMLSSCAFTFGFTFCFILFRPKLKKIQSDKSLDNV